MIPPRLLFDAQLCNTITPASRVSAFHSYDRSCETRESRGRARLPVTARCYSILELGLRFSIPFLATFSLKFESLSKSGGSMRRKRRIVVDRESGLFKSGSRKSSRILIKFLQGRRRRYRGVPILDSATTRFFISFVICLLRLRSFRNYVSRR